MRDSPSLKVIADHIRACAFTVVDGVIPGNEGRGYVLRRITRRAIRHGYKLGARKPFFHKLVADLAAEMGDAYPELRRDAQRVTDVLKQEEERFFQTIANGMEILERRDRRAAGRRRTRAERRASPSSCTTPTASRSTSPPTSAASAASPSTPPASSVAMAKQREQARASAKFKVGARARVRRRGDRPSTATTR